MGVWVNKTPLLKIINGLILLYPSSGDPRPPRCQGSLGVSWVTSLGSEAAMFFDLLNLILTWNRLQLGTSCSSSPRITGCIIMLINAKRHQRSLFLFSFPHMRSPQVSLKLRKITKFKLQNRTYKQFRLLEKCSFVQFGHI